MVGWYYQTDGAAVKRVSLAIGRPRFDSLQNHEMLVRTALLFAAQKGGDQANKLASCALVFLWHFNGIFFLVKQVAACLKTGQAQCDVSRPWYCAN